MKKEATRAKIRAMEIHLRNAVKAALTAQERLSAAREAAGLPDPQVIFTHADVKAMRREWYEEMCAVVWRMNNPDPEFRKIAEHVVQAARKKEEDERIAAARARGENVFDFGKRR